MSALAAAVLLALCQAHALRPVARGDALTYRPGLMDRAATLHGIHRAPGVAALVSTPWVPCARLAGPPVFVYASIGAGPVRRYQAGDCSNVADLAHQWRIHDVLEVPQEYAWWRGHAPGTTIWLITQEGPR